MANQIFAWTLEHYTKSVLNAEGNNVKKKSPDFQFVISFKNIPFLRPPVLVLYFSPPVLLVVMSKRNLKCWLRVTVGAENILKTPKFQPRVTVWAEKTLKTTKFQPLPWEGTLPVHHLLCNNFSQQTRGNQFLFLQQTALNNLRFAIG